MSLILQWFHKGSLGGAHNLLAMYSRDVLRIERASHLDHGYAMSHSSQGQIADRALIHVDTEVSAKCPLNSRMAYVSVSRARHDGQLFTNDRKRSTQRSETMFPLKYAWGQETYDAK